MSFASCIPPDAAWVRFRARIAEIVHAEQIHTVCELGAGANPLLPLDYVAARSLKYALVDSMVEELNKAPAGYQKILADIEATGLTLEGAPYDLILSQAVAEHLRYPRRFHESVHRLLRPGGIAFHFFPTLYALPFVLNRVLPSTVSEQVLRFVQPGRETEGAHGKFRAYYRWYRGPGRRQFGRFESCGFIIEEYVGFFGHGYYPGRTLQALEDRLTNALVRHPVPALTSYGQVVLRRR